MNHSIIPLNPEQSVEAVRNLSIIMRTLRDQQFVKDVDYGVIPGTGDKPTLLLPGMEKLMRALNAVPNYIERRVIVDYDKPLFHYEYECVLMDAATGQEIPGGRGIGLCTSMESAFGWRWVNDYEIPPHIDPRTLQRKGGKISEFKFAVEKGETSGQYGKPAEYWQQFRDAIANGTATLIERPTKKGKAEAYEIDGARYRIPNDGIFDQVNAICKRAQKRALGSAIKGAASVSEYFTVDIEDNAPDPLPAPIVVRRENEPDPQTPDKTVVDFATGEIVDAQPTWVTPDRINELVKRLANVLGISAVDVSKRLNWDTEDWLSYRSGKVAYDVAMGILNEPPAVEAEYEDIESPVEYADPLSPTEQVEQLDSMDKWVERHFERPAGRVLDLFEKLDWMEWETDEAAKADIIQLALDEEWHTVAYSANYVKVGKQAYISLHGAVPVRMYGRSTTFKAQVGYAWYEANNAEAWDDTDRVITFTQPLRIKSWKKQGSGNNTYYVTEDVEVVK